MSLAVNRGLDPHIPPPKPVHVVDRSFTVRRLHKNASSLVAAHPRADYMGPDDLVENLARARGFATSDLAILRISIGPERYTLICAPEQIWHSRKHDLVELKRIAGHVGRDCVLVPEQAVQRQPRLSTARVIEDASGIRVSMDQRMNVLIHLIERGSSTLFDCACVIEHPSPFSAVLHLVAIGVVRMDSNASLSPETRVDLPGQAGATA